jgi:hypothetical protein
VNGGTRVRENGREYIRKETDFNWRKIAKINNQFLNNTIS